MGPIIVGNILILSLVVFFAVLFHRKFEKINNK